jgi:hypothetical protein
MLWAMVVLALAGNAGAREPPNAGERRDVIAIEDLSLQAR